MKKNDGKNRHHIYSQKRFPELRNDPKNIARVPIKAHEAYHLLFAQKSPEEILYYLNRVFWNDMFYLEGIYKRDMK